MSPLDDQGAADLKVELRDVGKELQDPTLTEAQRNATAAKLRRLERRIDRLTESQTTDEHSKIADPTVRELMRTVSGLRDTVAKLVVGKDPELQAIQPHFEEILDEFPEVASIKDPERRIEAVKAIAARRFPDAQSRENATDDGGDGLPRGFRQGGGAPVQMRSPKASIDTLEKKLAAAKTPKDRAQIIDDWNETHPSS